MLKMNHRSYRLPTQKVTDMKTRIAADTNIFRISPLPVWHFHRHGGPVTITGTFQRLVPEISQGLLGIGPCFFETGAVEMYPGGDQHVVQNLWRRR